MLISHQHSVLTSVFLQTQASYKLSPAAWSHSPLSLCHQLLTHPTLCCQAFGHLRYDHKTFLIKSPLWGWRLRALAALAENWGSVPSPHVEFMSTGSSQPLYPHFQVFLCPLLSSVDTRYMQCTQLPESGKALRHIKMNNKKF